ncbi:hypothetical protein IQ60_20360 [Streptomyces europaeiscabiei]|nr:hypothetical protein IQ60_20360 [Streptomyces europaeiscabiei]
MPDACQPVPDVRQPVTGRAPVPDARPCTPAPVTAVRAVPVTPARPRPFVHARPAAPVTAGPAPP